MLHALPRWVLASMLPLAACTHGPPAPVGSPTPASIPMPTPSVSAQDQRFLAEAEAAGLFEAQSTELASPEDRTPDLRQFAEGMQRDHTQTAKLLDALLASKGLAPAPVLTAAQLQTIDDLRRTRPALFPRRFRTAQIQAHQQAIALFQMEASSGTDPDICAFAEQTLPLLREHLAAARHLPAR